MSDVGVDGLTKSYVFRAKPIGWRLGPEACPLLNQGQFFFCVRSALFEGE